MSETHYSQRLSKSRFVAGCQCHGLLWSKVHEPDAPELQFDRATQDRLDQGTQVGQLARTRFPGGVLIDLPYYELEARVAATASALASGAPAIFEAGFMADGVFVAVDVLERADGGFNLIEVKASNSQKDEHLPDAAIQTYVLRRSGIDVARAEIMHLNGEYRHPVGELFQRTDVTPQVEGLLPGVPDEIARQLEVINGPRPDTPIGPCCFEPDKCPFVDRCWPSVPDHIRTLYSVGLKTAWKYMQEGIDTIWDIPPDRRLSAAARRQLRALEGGAMIVEPGLAEALAPFSGRLGFLDFETVGRAIPVWLGMAPWGAAPAQFSYHEESPDGSISHVGWLAEGPVDPRPALAQALVEACAAADRIVTYTSFERRCIENLQQSVPNLADPLDAMKEKLIDLPTVIRDYVYHPDFGGSFSIKNVLTPLVPELSYDELAIADGKVASVEIARLLLAEDTIPADERHQLRRDLLEYCEQDTRAMVMLVRRLRELAA
ncbi:MAG: DUF2779 domain-containing protein [Gemmatimonadota bacterium]|nr:MAG: DUF2779 domain-containing protein [Gemmatimonadota bacterium]